MSEPRAAAEGATVWIAEDVDPEDPFRLTGRFSGHLAHGDRAPSEEFQGLAVDEALAWGRARAGVVLIRAGDRDAYHSAGARNPDPDVHPPLPPDGLRTEPRRLPGFEALDNREDDPPVLWDVHVAVDGAGGSGARPFRAAVRDHAAARDVRAPAPDGGAVSADFRVRASSERQARELAHAVADRAFAALPRRAWRRRRLGVLSVAVHPHAAGKPRLGAGGATPR